MKLRRYVVTVESYPEPTEDHQVRQQGDDVVQRLLTALDEDHLGDGLSLLREVMQHHFEFFVCGRVLKLSELVAIAWRCEQS